MEMELRGVVVTVRLIGIFISLRLSKQEHLQPEVRVPYMWIPNRSGATVPYRCGNGQSTLGAARAGTPARDQRER